MYAAVRVRGQPDTPKRIRQNLDQLGLKKKNSLVLVPETAPFKGMLNAVKDAAAYGEISDDLAARILEERGETAQGSLADAVSDIGYDSIQDLIEALDNDDVSLTDLRKKGFRNVVRMRPPTKGYRDTKRQYRQSGSLGYWGDDIKSLINRMI